MCDWSRGVFVRAFECPALQPKPWVPTFNLTHLTLHGTHKLSKDNVYASFAACVKKNADPRRHFPTSFARHDIGFKSYANGFGLLLSPTLSPKCSYPFDAWTFSDRKKCKTNAYDPTFTRRRVHHARKLCTKSAKQHDIIGSQANSFGCCGTNMSLALRYQREYNWAEHTSCTRLNNEPVFVAVDSRRRDGRFLRASGGPTIRRVRTKTTATEGPTLLAHAVRRRQARTA